MQTSGERRYWSDQYECGYVGGGDWEVYVHSIYICAGVVCIRVGLPRTENLEAVTCNYSL